MKKIIIMAIISMIATINVQAETKNTEMCKTFINKAKSYQSTMKNDDVSKATLAFYKDEVVGQCGNIASKMTYEKNFFAKALMKKDAASVNNCKMSIQIAKKYDETANKSFIITNAHKVNVIDNCGTLVAKKAPAFCFFDVVDNSKEDLKERCLASVEKARTFQSTNNKDIELVQSHKDEVRANCGTLMTRS
ncbi:hypothetical protein [Sulfurovum sp.]|uniref:hypothetical protein n=1 Tax=Sulfurovum sp. TaxID=1969726 RepID=UPI002867FBE5|nr:hypothetical protein [Sulfurovum sp.]